MIPDPLCSCTIAFVVSLIHNKLILEFSFFKIHQLQNEHVILRLWAHTFILQSTPCISIKFGSAGLLLNLPRGFLPHQHCLQLTPTVFATNDEDAS
jgi:hypothetical protein